MSDLFELPSLGADMETGTVLQWYVELGDAVERGSLVGLVSTEKADVDVEIWRNGTVIEFLVEIGQEVPVGTPLLRLDSLEASPVPELSADSELVPEPVPERRPHAEPELLTPIVAVESAAAEPAPRSTVPVVQRRVAASPRARLVAAERGLDLAQVHGTGPDGAVLERDLSPVPVAPPPVAAVSPISADDRKADDREAGDRQEAMRQAIADRMAKANTQIPHYHLDLDVDLGPTLTWLERHNRDLDVASRVLPAALLVKATAGAASAVPELNGFWVGGRFEAAERSDVAVVVSLRNGGLVTPKISDGANKTVDEVMAELKEIVAGARRGSLRSSWMSGAGITVTNLGDNGADQVHGVIFPPQVALVGFGQITERPAVVDGAVVPRPMVTVSLAADHRATDGAIGSRFLRALVDQLSPSNLEADQDQRSRKL